MSIHLFNKKKVGLICASLLALSLAACGNDSSSSEDNTTTKKNGAD